MKTPLAGFEMRAPTSVDAALHLMASEPGVWRPFAGGTDLMVLMEAGKLPPGRYLSLRQLGALRGIAIADDAVTLGALTTYTDVLRHELLGREFPLLCEAARQTGGVATQNRGTIGGNIANASPAADTPPALLVYDARIELRSARGRRVVEYHSFHTGYKKMDIAADEIISSITLPRRRQPWIATYRKVGTRRAQAIAKVCFAAALDVTAGTINDARIAFGSVAPTVKRCPHVEDALRGRRLGDSAVEAALAQLSHDIAPIDDVRSTAKYRFAVARNLLAEFLRTPA